MIVHVNASYIDSPTVGPIVDLVYYMEEDSRKTQAVSPLALRTGRPLSSQSYMLSTNIRKLIMETQEKPKLMTKDGYH